MPKIPTFDSDGNPNGWILPVWNELDKPDLAPAQIYVTAIAPRTRKGPHLHMVREGRFHVISGNVRIVTKRAGKLTAPDGETVDADLTLIHSRNEPVLVTAGVLCALYNYGDTEALVINMPNAAWSKENPDDHPVTNWQDPADWKVQS